ncbi:MAG: DUF2461 domain-containing protein [Turicibacter sp.]|nr:DUF2461 domain-containing protein [Turicibacter sp.]
MIFKQDTLDYLRDVKKNNSKTWFVENKDRYNDSLLEPLKELVEQLTATMLDIDATFVVEPRVDRTISRIYRDTRFSKDKSLYKNRMWVTFKKKGSDKVDFPTFFFEVSPDGFFYGMGFFSASVKSMNAIRTKIDADEQAFLVIIQRVKDAGIFLPEGESYKRNRYEGVESEVASWYNRKNLYLINYSEHVDELFSEDLPQRLKEGFDSLAPLYRFFTDALFEQMLKDEGFERM